MAVGTVSRLALVLAPVVGVVLAGAPAWAQPGGPGGFGERLRASITAREVDRFESILELGEDQRELVRMLFEGYREQFREKAEALRARFREAREEARQTRDWSIFRDLREDMEAFREERERMEETFLQDVKAVLTPEQMERWPRVERAHRRSRYLSSGFVRGERVDLIGVVRNLDLGVEVEGLEPLLESYAIALDRELVKRVEAYEDGWERFGELRRAGDREAIRELMEEGREASLRVREVNHRFTRQIAGVLPEDAATRFRDAVKREMFPDVYRERRARVSLEAAIGFEDLTADQAARVSALASRYEREAEAVNGRLVEAIEAREEELSMREMFRRGRGRDGPTAELWREKRELERSTVEQLKEMLTEEQVERLPEAPTDRDRRRWRDRDDDRIL